MSQDHQDHMLKGMACAATAYFMLSMMMVFSKLLSQTHSVIEVSFYRNLIAVLPLVFFIFVMGNRDIMKIRSKPRVLILRGVLGTFGMFLTFGAFSLLPLADATVLLFASSIFLPVLSYFFLKESISHARWSAIALGMIGVLIMARPTGEVNIKGIAVALSAAFVHAIIGTILRHLGKSEPPLTVTFYFLLIGTIMSAVPMPVVAKPIDVNAMWLIVGLGMTGLAGQAFLSSAFKFAPASVVTIFNYTGLIWATFFGWWIWNDWPDTPVWIGGGIVIGSNIFIVMRERYLLNRRRDEERQREQEESLS
jgi:drug/metabolite transporter (DMT)-like permease